MATKRELCRASNGVFVRNLGWKMTASGGYTQHKFYLGRDESKARLAGLRLEQLWQQVCTRWNRENLYELRPTERPVWDGVTLDIAEAVRNGEAVARVRLPMPLSALFPKVRSSATGTNSFKTTSPSSRSNCTMNKHRTTRRTSSKSKDIGYCRWADECSVRDPVENLSMLP